MNKKIASELAVGVILLLAIAIGGIFWLQNKNTVPAETAVPVAATQPAITGPVTQATSLVNYDIPELGIKIKVSQSLKNDLTYVYSSENGNEYAKFSLNSIKSNVGCAAKDMPLGALVKFKGSISDLKGDEKTQIENAGAKQFSGFAVYFSGSQSLCSSKDDINNVQTKALNELSAAVSSSLDLSATAVDATANWQTYTNTTLGYQITFPETWKDYKTEKFDVYGNHATGDPSEKMGFGDNFGKWKETDMWTFGIEEGAKATYKEAVKKNPTNVVYLGDDRNGNALFCSGGCCVAGETDISDSFGEARCDEVPSILKTFKLTF